MAKNFDDDDLGLGVSEEALEQLTEATNPDTKKSATHCPDTSSKPRETTPVAIVSQPETNPPKATDTADNQPKSAEKETRPIGCKVSDEMFRRIKIRIAQEDIKLKDFIKDAIEQRLETPLEK